jgi:hypothetical protein
MLQWSLKRQSSTSGRGCSQIGSTVRVGSGAWTPEANVGTGFGQRRPPQTPNPVRRIGRDVPGQRAFERRRTVQVGMPGCVCSVGCAGRYDPYGILSGDCGDHVVVAVVVQHGRAVTLGGRGHE